MKGCLNWRDAVADYALDIARSPAFEAHLAGCADCAEALRESQAAAARMNAALDRRARVEPPSYGPDRVMARIGVQNPVRATLWWRWALVGCATVALIASVLWGPFSMPRRPMQQPSVGTLVSWRSPTDDLLQPPVGTAWPTVPRLGEGIFEVRPLGETHVQ